MKKKITALMFIVILSLTMASVAGAAGFEPQGCPTMGTPRYCDIMQ